MSPTQDSTQTGQIQTFGAADYAVFGVTLVVSAGIGMFFAIRDRHRNTTDEFLLGGRGMHFIPVTLSLLSSFVAATFILGTPAEMYIYNTMYWWISLAMLFTVIGAAHIFLPVFYNLGITSVFQYTEMRFGRVTRTIASIIYLVWMLVFMAIVLYGPSLALNAVTGLSLWGSIFAVSAVCIFYTALGGMKAVLWTDTLQMCIIYAGLLAVLIVGSNKLGGFSNAWNIANKHQRIVMFEANPDPRVRHSFWSVVVGGAIFWCTIFGTNQAQVQRALSVRSLKHSKLAIWLNWPGMASVMTLTCMVGVVMYAFYADCDPVKFGLVEKTDQLLPLYMMDMLGDMNGLPGLLLSCIFSGSLSTMSSALNAVSAVLLEDYVRPLCCQRITPFKATILSKIFVVVGGLISLALAFAVSQIGSTVLHLTYVLFGVLGGPLLGMFSLGMLFPWSNKWGGGVGLLGGLGFGLWVGLGTFFSKTSVTPKSPVYTHGCNWAIRNVTTTPLPDVTTVLQPEDVTSLMDKYTGINRLYTMSYIWYSGLGVLITVVVGMLVSLATGITDTSTINPKLICPFFDIFFFWLPERIRKPLRFGVRHGEVLPNQLRDAKHDGYYVSEDVETQKKKAMSSGQMGTQDNKAFEADQVSKL